MPKPHFRLKPRAAVPFDAEQMGAHLAVGAGAGLLRTFGGWLPNPDPILRNLGMSSRVYCDLLADPIVGGHVRRRKAAVLALEWRLDGDQVPDNVHAVIEQMLQDLAIYDVISQMLDAPLFGWQPLEVLWQTSGLWLPEKVVAKPQDWFVFNAANELCLINDGAFGRQALPPYKFLCPTQEASYTNPYGRADLALVYWATVFKRAGLKFWAQFTEKYGSPWLIGKEPRSNTPQDTDKLLDSLEALAGSAVGTIPNDSSVEIIEAAGKTASVEAYDKLLRYCRSEIAIALLGQDQTTEHNSTHASAKAGLEVTDDIRDGDARVVCAGINQLIDWVCELNFGAVARPQFVLYEQGQINTVQAARDEILSRCGARFSAQYFQRVYALEDGDLLGVAAPNTVDGISAPANFAEAAATDAGLVLETLTPPSGSLNDQAEALTAPLVKALQKGTDPNQVLDVLIGAYPHMDTQALQDELARLIFLSGLVGRIEAREELQA